MHEGHHMHEARAFVTHTRYVGMLPEMYDRHLGPVIFRPYADELARRVAAEAKGPVLEIACGTGVLTQRLRAAFPCDIRLVATDLNEPMLNYARARLGTATIDWQPADVEELPFQPESFSAVACQFGLTFVPNKQEAIRQIRRVLTDNGFLAFSIWSDFRHNPFAGAADEVVRQFISSEFFSVPFGYDDAELWQHWLADNGFTDIRIEPIFREACSPSARSFAEGLIRGYPVGIELEEQGFAVEPVVDQLAAELARIGGESPYRSNMCALVGTARAKKA